MKAKKENKYLVFKLEDLDRYFSQFTKGKFTTEDEQNHLDSLTWNEVTHALQHDNKYIVCNQDEPYADGVWDIIIEFEKLKKNKFLLKGEVRNFNLNGGLRMNQEDYHIIMHHCKVTGDVCGTENKCEFCRVARYKEDEQSDHAPFPNE